MLIITTTFVSLSTGILLGVEEIFSCRVCMNWSSETAGFATAFFAGGLAAGAAFTGIVEIDNDNVDINSVEAAHSIEGRQK